MGLYTTTYYNFSISKCYSYGKGTFTKEWLSHSAKIIKHFKKCLGICFLEHCGNIVVKLMKNWDNLTKMLCSNIFIHCAVKASQPKQTYHLVLMGENYVSNTSTPVLVWPHNLYTTHCSTTHLQTSLPPFLSVDAFNTLVLIFSINYTEPVINMLIETVEWLRRSSENDDHLQVSRPFNLTYLFYPSASRKETLHPLFLFQWRYRLKFSCAQLGKMYCMDKWYVN